MPAGGARGYAALDRGPDPSMELPMTLPAKPWLTPLALVCLVACQPSETTPGAPAPSAATPDPGAGLDAPPSTPTLPPSADEPPPLDNAPPQTIAQDLPRPAPADQQALDAARAAAEALLVGAEGADSKLATGGMPDAAQLATLDLLRKIAAHTRRKQRLPFRVVHAPLWDELKAVAEPDLKAFDSPTRSSRLRAAAALLVEGGDRWDRAAAIAFIKLALDLRAQAEGDLAADAPLRDALLARLVAAADDEEAANEERRYIFETLGFGATDRMTPVLVAAGHDDPHPPARRDALGALAKCAWAGVCRPDPGALRAIYRHTMDEAVHSSLVDVGAALKLPAVSDWCAGEKRLMRSLACRQGLAGMQTPVAFERLLPYVTARDADERTHSGRSYDFRDDFALLDRYADADYATDRYYALLDTVLDRIHRSGFATGFILRRMATLDDAERALALLEAHRPAYIEQWGEAPTARGLRFLYHEMGHTRRALQARVAGRPPPPHPGPLPNVGPTYKVDPMNPPLPPGLAGGEAAPR